MKKHIPNIITIIRAILIIPIVVFIILDYKLISGIIFSIAAFSDFLDGFLARRWKACSDLGRKLDPFIDKSLSIAVLILIAIKNPLNLYLIITEGLIGLINLCRYQNDDDVRPIQIGRMKTVFMFTYISLFLFDIFYFPYFIFIIVFDIIVFIYYLSKLNQETRAKVNRRNYEK